MSDALTKAKALLPSAATSNALQTYVTVAALLSPAHSLQAGSADWPRTIRLLDEAASNDTAAAAQREFIDAMNFGRANPRRKRSSKF